MTWKGEKGRLFPSSWIAELQQNRCNRRRMENPGTVNFNCGSHMLPVLELYNMNE